MSEDRVKKGANKYAKIKDVRKVMFDIQNDPLLKRLEMTNNQLPSNLSVNDFVEARAHEINHFTEYINNRPGTKLTHQMLPRSLRRRAMSHNYFRIPLRVRYKSYKEFEHTLKSIEENKEAAEEKKNQEGFKVRSWNQKPKRAKTRKHKRSTKALLKAYHERIIRGGQWMETHIWHSKRFHMQSLWGFKVPKRNHEKLKRSTYKYTQLSSCMIDLSYYTTLKLEAQNKIDLIEVLQKIGCFKDMQSEDWTQFKFDFNRLYTFDFVNPNNLGSKHCLVSPCNLMSLNDTSCLLHFHPAAFEEISLILCEFNQLQVNKIWMNKFELMGSETIKMLYSVLKLFQHVPPLPTPWGGGGTCCKFLYIPPTLF